MPQRPSSSIPERARAAAPALQRTFTRRVLGRMTLGQMLLGAVLSCWVMACGSVQRPDGGTGLLPVGASAPDVVGTNAAGERVRLSSRLGHPAVVYFYPMDETPGCTKEACAFRDAFDRYTQYHVTIFGVSQDSEQSHREFSTEQKLPFPLVADEDGSVTRAYGVPSRLGMSSRVTFLVDGSGRVARVWPDVDPGVHANEVLAAASALGSTSTEQ